MYRYCDATAMRPLRDCRATLSTRCSCITTALGRYIRKHGRVACTHSRRSFGLRVATPISTTSTFQTAALHVHYRILYRNILSFESTDWYFCFYICCCNRGLSVQLLYYYYYVEKRSAFCIAPRRRRPRSHHVDHRRHEVLQRRSYPRRLCAAVMFPSAKEVTFFTCVYSSVC